MKFLAYLRGFVAIFVEYRDIKAAHRNGVLHIAIERRKKAERKALKGKK